MKTGSLTDQSVDTVFGVSRSDVIAKLRANGQPLSVAAIAELTGLHLNTARFHLDGLVQDRIATRIIEERDGPGRPRVLYSIRVGMSGPRSFGLLAEMLTGLIASLEGAVSTSLNVGQTWGRQLVERPVTGQPISANQALASLHGVLDAIGFQPEFSTSTEGNVEVRLHHCPFQEVAERHTNVVCALHLGLMQGALLELGAPIEADSVTPFVKTNLCTAAFRIISVDAT
jgi:predicted ArsR family transcriptional regulator